MTWSSLARRSSMAAWLLMLGLCFAPSLALAAMSCAPHCCPATAADAERDDCRAGFANRVCCSEAPTPLASFAPATPDAPSLPAILPRSVVFETEGLDAPRRGVEAERALRTSPLRLSVVLLI